MNSPARIPLAFLITIFLGQLASTEAQTVWDAGGASDTSINLSANWNNNTANSLNGSQAGQFGTGGTTATMNVAGFFSTLTFNRDSALGFTINGPSTLSVLASGSGATANFNVSDTAGNGTTTINAPLQVNTDAGGTRLLVVDNREAGTTGASLVISNGLGASNSNAYGLRFGSSGSTRISGAITGNLSSNIQQASIAGQNMSGTVTIAGNQSLGSAQVNIAGNGGSVNGNVASTARFVMGDSASDVQSWGGTTVNQAATVEIKSTATLSGSVSLSNAATNGSSGGTLDVSGNLAATTLAIGGSAYSGVLRVSGNATFSGAITSGATAGSKIIGGNTSPGTLTLASGTIGSAVALGGSGSNENNLALVKNTTGTLTVNSATNTYTGGTTLVEGGGSGSFGIALGANNALGSGPLTIGTSATTDARLRMAGFNQTVSALSSGAVGARVIENFGSANSTFSVSQSSNTTYSGFLRDRSTSSASATGNLALVKDGSGTLSLSNASNQYTGATALSGGVLEVTSLSNGGIVKTVTTTAGCSTVTMSDTTGLSTGMTFVAANLPTGFSVSTVTSGSITISTSSGIVSGTSTAHFGTASSLGLSTSDAANLVFGGGTLRYTGGNSSTDRNFAIQSGHSARWDVANPATTLTLTGGAAASTGGMEKLGGGILSLNATNSHSGGTVITAGTLRAAAVNALGSTSNVTVANTATLEVAVSGAISDTAAVTLAGGTLLRSATVDETFGALTLTANSTINYGAAGIGTLSFGAYANGSDSFRLSVLNFREGSVLRFASNITNITDSTLFSFDNGFTSSWDGSTFTITAIPEPTALAALGVFAILAAVRVIRRYRSASVRSTLAI